VSTRKQIEGLEDRLKSLEQLIRSSLVPPQVPSTRVEEADARTPISLTSSVASIDPFALPLNPHQGDSVTQTSNGATGRRANSGLDTSIASSMVLSTSDNLDFWPATAAQQIELNQHRATATPIDLQPKVKYVGDKKCSLPPPEGGYFLLQEYLVDFNAAIPLFDRVTISTCFEDCYNGRAEGSVELWVAMKLVLAIAHRLRAMSPLGVRQDSENADIYLEESLSNLGNLVILPPSLLLCQIYLATAVVIST